MYNMARLISRSFFDNFSLDLRYTLRTLRRDRGFTAFAILIVGLGIGASATIFSVVNAVLVRPLPFRDPGRLVWVVNHDTAGLSGQTTQVGHLLDLRTRAQSFSELAGYMAFYGVGDHLLSGSGQPERLSGVDVTGNFFQTLGIQPQFGRLFTAEECQWHGPKAVLLGHGIWTRRFGADPSIVGRAIVVNEEPVTVIGVLPAAFDFASVFAPGRQIDLYFAFPLTQETNRWGNTLAIVGRLAPGATLGGAQAEVRILGEQLTKANPNRNAFEGKISTLAEHVSGRLRTALLVLACAVGVVMLIVCANLSNLLLARTATRQKEIAIRTALGAGRRRLVLQMLTEGVTLSCCGAALGVILATIGTRLLSRLDAVSIPLLRDVRTDWTALAFTLLAAIATGVLFGLAPALQTPAAALHDALKDAGRGSTGRGRGWVRSGLVVSEIAFACVLLAGAGLLARSFVRVLDVDLGFHPESAAAIRVDPDSRYDTAARQNAYFDDVLRRGRDLPGVRGAGLTDALPLGKNRSWGAGVVGQTYPKGSYPVAYVRLVSDGYMSAMGIPLREGRDIAETDTLTSDRVMVINETMARALFPTGGAIGGLIRGCGGAPNRVIGVVGDVRHLALEQGAGMEMYYPIRQCHDVSSVDLVVRSAQPPAQLASALRASLRPIAPNLPGNEFRLLQGLVDKAVSPRRFVLLLIGGFAGFALILASLGIYSVVSYSVGQRAQEIGIRMALGASSAGIQLSIIRQTLGLAAMGILLGAAASRVLAGALGSLLYGVKAGDPVTFLAVPAVLAAIAAVASYVPARRASRADPSLALRAS
jgi:predicted permease